MKRLVFASVTCALMLCVVTASAVQPAVSVIRPVGFQRGQQVEATFSGARLGDVEELLFYQPGVAVAGIEKVNENSFKAKLDVAADCQLGLHAVRVRTATGISDLRLFTVGALPEVEETEPNNDFLSPQAVSLNSTVTGVVQNEDVDYFVVEAKQGDRIVAELEGLRLGYTFFDPYVAILNEDRFELARSDDASLLWQDCYCAVEAPKDGKYIVQVRESAYGGNGASHYRLHVGTFPRPAAVVPAGGRPGETVQVRWIGGMGNEWTENVTLPTDAPTEYALFAQTPQGIAPSPNMVRVIDLQNAVEAEPNNDRTVATAATAPGAMNGVIQEPDDVDYFKFTATKGQVFDIRVYARNTLRSPLDAVLYVQRANGGNVGSNDDSAGPDSYLRFTAPEDGEFFVMIRDHLNNGGPHFAYRIELTPVAPKLTLGVAEKVRYIPTIMPVPKGNRVAMLLNAARADFGGELNVNFEGLPAGMTVETIPMAADRTDIPVLVSVAPDAANSGALVDVVGRPADENIKVVGHLNQRSMLVRGQNNRDVWGHDAQRLAMSVADAVPFSIEIVQPQVPIVRNGSMNLKVVAKRDEGFNAPIRLQMLYNPPGIGSSGSVSIAGDQTEALIPVTANNGATIKSWPIIVMAQAAHAGGTVEVASQIAQLEVADSPFGFTFQKAAGELKQETAVAVELEVKTEFEGEAKIELLGLPANTATPPEGKVVTKETTQVVFPVTIDESARPGVYKSLVCRATIMKNGEPIVMTLGTGELRVDKPLPPKVATTQPAAKPAEAKPAPMPTEKPLSRLEQLRLEKQQAEAAGG
ncbi:MAG: PPC domain-containing protein [Pirellulaceae bacterium]